MTINCPQGFRRAGRIGAVAVADMTVQVFGGVCDSCDMCGIRRCRYFDDSMEGTRRFMEAVTEAHGTIAGVLAERERQADHRRRAVN